MRSRSARALAVVLVAILAAVMLVGCGDDTSKANEAVTAANLQVDAFNKLDGTIAATMEEIDALGDTEADAAKAVELLDKAAADLEKRGEAIEGVKAEYAKIEAMNVPETTKTYAKQQIEIWELQAKLDGDLGTMLEKMKEIYAASASGGLDEAKGKTLADDVQALSKQVDDQQSELDKKAQESSDYFDQNVKS